MNIVFLGTPDFAVPSLDKIIASRHKVLAAVTQPDKPVGRSGQICFSPVKQVALQNGIKVLQYNKIRLEGVEDLKALKPDIMVTCAFGQILSKEILEIAPHGVINVHGSLLPKYRGAAPVQQAVINGDEETGVTIMKTEEGVDTGDMILVKKTPIYPNETAGELFERLSEIGAEAVVEALDLIEENKAVFVKQNDELATHVKMFKKEDGIINFSLSSKQIHDFVRGMNPWPCAFTFLNGKTLKVFKADVADELFGENNGCENVGENVGENSLGEIKNLACGAVAFADKNHGLIIKTSSGGVRLACLQEEGGKKMEDKAFLLGHKIAAGTLLKSGK